MMAKNEDGLAKTWKEIVSSLLKLGVMSYGGPAIMGIMQTELHEKRHWVTKDRFVEGLSLVNTLPGAGATQLAIFLGYARGGWWGGLVGGLCFVLPAFFIMLALTIGYSALGATPIMRGALYGLGPVVLAIFLVAVYRLGKAAVGTVAQALIAVGAATAAVFTSIGIAGILLLAGGIGLLLFHSRKTGSTVLVSVAVVLGWLYLTSWSWLAPPALHSAPVSQDLQEEPESRKRSSGTWSPWDSSFSLYSAAVTAVAWGASAVLTWSQTSGCQRIFLDTGSEPKTLRYG